MITGRVCAPVFDGYEYFDDEIIAEYFREIDERFYSGLISKNYYQMLRRQVQRFLVFSKTGEVKLPNMQSGPTLTLTPEFAVITAKFLDDDSLNPNTRNDMRWVAHKYFKRLEEQGYVDLTGVGAKQVQKFMVDCSKQMTPTSMHNVKLYMKKLYAHLFSTGQSESPYKALLSFPVNRESKIYPTLPKDDIAGLLNAIDRRSKQGKRDYAIMLLGAVLGLRACDVIGLKLADIDWVKGEIKILQSKTSKTVILPLTKDVGEALQDYILHARPQSGVKQVFLRAQGSVTQIASAVTIGELYSKYCKKAGLPDNKRFHSLRRSLGTSMVTSGVTIYDVAQVLGDADIDSTKPYIALDVKHLKICALPFGGIAPKAGAAQ
ncbi:hypothetical protein FACS189425_10770 [Clostridia bacterium]|nr:hypothetical protein FACS189425_10770 [Clostridia bacterium]